MPPLDGIRVIALTGERGAYCAKLLADLGADVFDIEPIGGSDERRLPPFMRSDASVSLHFLHFHRGRQSLVLDRETLRARSKNTPFDRATMQGRVLGTWVAGTRVFGD